MQTEVKQWLENTATTKQGSVHHIFKQKVFDSVDCLNISTLTGNASLRNHTRNSKQQVTDENRNINNILELWPQANSELLKTNCSMETSDEKIMTQGSEVNAKIERMVEHLRK